MRTSLTVDPTVNVDSMLPEAPRARHSRVIRSPSMLPLWNCRHICSDLMQAVRQKRFVGVEVLQ
jgi:hypothetical protein